MYLLDRLENQDLVIFALKLASFLKHKILLKICYTLQLFPFTSLELGICNFSVYYYITLYMDVFINILFLCLSLCPAMCWKLRLRCSIASLKYSPVINLPFLPTTL